MKRVSELAAELRPYLQNISSQVIAVDDGKIRLLRSGGTTVRYDPTDTGLVAALAAAAAGDAVLLPACSISGSAGFTVPAGVTLSGVGKSSVLAGNVTANGGAYVTGLQITVASGVALTLAGAGVTRAVNVSVANSSAGTIGIEASGAGALVFNCFVSNTQLFATGLRLSGAGSVAFYTYGNGQTTGAEMTGGGCGLFGCTALAFTNGLVNNGGSNSAVETICSGQGATDVRNTSGTLTLYGCQYDPAKTVGTLTYGTGDRAAYSVEDYHATDIEAAALTRHLPTPPAASFGVVSNGSNWTSSGSAMAMHAGGGAADYVAYWASGSAITGDAGLKYTQSLATLLQTRYAGAAANAIRRADGSSGSPAYVATNTSLGNFQFGVWNGSDFTNVVTLRGLTAEAHSSGSYAAHMVFLTTDTGGASQAEKMRLTAGGRLGLGTTAPDKVLEINDASGGSLRLTYNDSNGSATTYVDLAVDSSGNLSVTPSGGVMTLAAQSVGIGSAPSAALWIQRDGSQPEIFLNTAGSVATIFPNVVGKWARGTIASPSAVNSGDTLFAFGGRGYGTTKYAPGNTARIAFIASEAFTDSAYGTYIAFETTASGGTARTEKLRVDTIGINVTGSVIVAGDGGGVASTVGLSNVSNTAANSTGVGTIKFKGATNRDSTGFIKIYIGTTAYYVPVFSAITG